MDKQIVELTDGVIGVVVPESSYMWTVVGNELLMVPHIGLSARKKYYDLPPGQWQILGLGNQLTEEQWKGIVGISHENVKIDWDVVEEWVYGNIYKDYELKDSLYYTATESGLSLLTSKGLKPQNTLILKKAIMTNDQIESAATDHASKYPEHLKTDIVLHYGLGIVRGLKEGREELAAKDKEIEDCKHKMSEMTKAGIDWCNEIREQKQKIERLTKIIFDFRISRPS